MTTHRQALGDQPGAMTETGTVSLLLVEDNPADAELVREQLIDAAGLHAEVSHVERLSDAIDHLSKVGSDCVLLDLGLPDAHGLEALVRVRSSDANVAIVVLTGRDDEETGIRALQEGAQDYLVKGRVDGHILGRGIRYAIERKRLDAAKAQFIARAAHELRTPLTVLAGLGETLAANLPKMTPEQTEPLLEALARQGRRARTLIANLLDLSQIESGNVVVELEPVSVVDAAEQVREATPADTEIVIAKDIDRSLRVMVDSMRFEQILVNLVTNARKYGGGKVELRAVREYDTAVVSVCDEGPGIPEDLAGQLFEPFSRGSNRGKSEGSGLGLAICRRLVEAVGGEIWHEPNVPHGACFLVRLGLAPGEPPRSSS